MNFKFDVVVSGCKDNERKGRRGKRRASREEGVDG